MNTTDAILKAARQRFSDYGPSKTTIAEIAADCGMSVGNVYRHFENKQAIMVACMKQQLQEKLEVGIHAAAKQDHALDALRSFLQTRLSLGHAQFAGTRHLFDLLDVVERHHHQLLLDYEQKVIAAIADILQKGIENGQFESCNIMQRAYDIHQATLRYNHPITLKKHALELLSEDLNRLVNLLYSGLKRS